jgi:hypothetical protein
LQRGKRQAEKCFFECHPFCGSCQISVGNTRASLAAASGRAARRAPATAWEVDVSELRKPSPASSREPHTPSKLQPSTPLARVSTPCHQTQQLRVLFPVQ